MRKLRIALTGATGLLGRNMLFEIIKNHQHNLENLEIFVLGRNSTEHQLRDRIYEILMTDGLDYLAVNTEDMEDFLNRLHTVVHIVNIDLTVEKLNLHPDDFQKLNTAPIDYFFHVASLTDFRSTPAVMDSLTRVNVYGTQQILDLVSSLNVREFVYISSAYCCGYKAGLISPDYTNLNGEFRNFYEKTKAEAEILVRDISKKGLKYRIFRPSIICGRLQEEQLGSVNKFDVFYGWAAWFLRQKLKKLGNWNDIYQTKVNLDMRLCYSLNSINIVPADFAAKFIYEVCMKQLPGYSFHVVNTDETPNNVIFPFILSSLNIEGVERVDRVPTNPKNKLERFYYKTVGHIFTPYMTAETMLFHNSGECNKLDITCPKVDADSLSILMSYAAKQNFGLMSQQA